MRTATVRASTTIALIAASAVMVYAVQRPQIPTGGEIPDGRKRDRTPEKITEVVRRVQGNVYVVAGIGSNVSVLAGDDGILMIIRDRMREMIAKGMTFDEVSAAKPTRDFDARFDVEQGGRNEVRTTQQWLKSYYDLLAKER